MITTTDHTATVETIEWLRQMIEPLYAALDKLPLKVWTEASRFGCDGRYSTEHGPSNSYYIHVRGADRTLKLRVSDHGLDGVTTGMTRSAIQEMIDDFLEEAELMEAYDADAEKSELVREWQREADEALAQGDPVTRVVDSVEYRLDSCDDDDEQRKLAAMTEQDVRDVMAVLDDNRREEGLPTYAQMLGAYAHVHYMQSSEQLMGARADYGNHEAVDAIQQLHWTRRYFDQRFPGFRWQWSCAEFEPDEQIQDLLTEVLECMDVPS